MFLDPPDAVQHALRVSVSSVDYDHVYHRLDQRGDTLFGITTYSHCRSNQQTFLGILGGVREISGFLNILNRDQAAKLEIFVDDQHFFDPVPVQQVQYFVLARVFLHGNKLVFGRHDIAHGVVQPFFKAHVTTGDNTHQFITIHHRDTGYIMLVGQVENLANGRVGTDRNRILDHTRFVFLHNMNLLGLLLQRHVLVYHTDAAFLRHGYGKARLGHRIHGGRYQWCIDFYFPGQLRCEPDIGWQNFRVGGFE